MSPLDRCLSGAGAQHKLRLIRVCWLSVARCSASSQRCEVALSDSERHAQPERKLPPVERNRFLPIGEVSQVISWAPNSTGGSAYIGASASVATKKTLKRRQEAHPILMGAGSVEKRTSRVALSGCACTSFAEGSRRWRRIAADGATACCRKASAGADGFANDAHRQRDLEREGVADEHLEIEMGIMMSTQSRG